MRPSYISALENGELDKKIAKAQKSLKQCVLCPRACRVDRTKGEKGFCKTGEKAIVASYAPHFGEEAPLVGTNGSGTIFFARCNMLCNFCQNFEISHLGEGVPVSARQLADIMLYLKQKQCHNINFVTPSHVVPHILSALKIAAQKGLDIPLVYNTGAYDTVETLELLEGVVDIYMPDFKFMTPETARMVCKAKDYPEIAKNALKEMHRQVGDLEIDSNGIAEKGILLRHLVLPDGLSDTPMVMKFVHDHISSNTYINIMDQYRPCGNAGKIRRLGRSITKSEYETAVKAAAENGLTRLDKPRRTYIVF